MTGLRELAIWLYQRKFGIEVEGHDLGKFCWDTFSQ